MNDFEKEMQEEFFKEVRESLQQFDHALLQLDKDRTNVEHIKVLFRIVHNIKGNSYALGFNSINELAHFFEDYLAKIRDGQETLTDTVYNFLDRLFKLLQERLQMVSERQVDDFDNHQMHELVNQYIQIADTPSSSSPSPESAATLSPTPPPEVWKVDGPSDNERLRQQMHVISNHQPVKGEGVDMTNDNVNQTLQLEKGVPTGDLDNRYIEFSLGEDHFALSIFSIKEVVSIPETTPIPRSPDYFIGLMNLRGQVISVIDLRKKLQIKPLSQHEENAVIIVELNGLQFGLVVDSINRVINCTNENVSRVPHTGNSVKTDYIGGVYKENNQLIMLLDIVKILNVEDLVVLEKNRMAA